MTPTLGAPTGEVWQYDLLRACGIPKLDALRDNGGREGKRGAWRTGEATVKSSSQPSSRAGDPFADMVFVLVGSVYMLYYGAAS